MPATPPAANPLHLLRALLREASYLPDAAARAYFRRYLVARFKAYQPASQATASLDVQAVDKYRHRAFARRHAAVIHDRAPRQLRKARKGLHLLRRANQGDGACLHKLLCFAYARVGRRKYALLDDLLKPDPAWPDAPAPLQQLYRTSLRCLQYLDAPAARNGLHVANISRQYPRLRAVVNSQAQRELSPRRAMKRPQLKMPVLNTWARPMPARRAVNNARRWYAETMTRLLPALPADEWDRIEAISTGKQRIAFAKTRAPALPPSPQPESDDRRFEHLLHRSLAMDKLAKADRPQALHRPHPTTARSMRRLYATLLTAACKLEYDDTRNRWTPVWGPPRKSLRSKSYTAPVDHALFAGVDPQGLAPKAPKTKEASPLLARPRNDDGDVLRFPFFADWLPATHPTRVELDRWKKERDAVRAKLAAPGGDPS